MTFEEFKDQKSAFLQAQEILEEHQKFEFIEMIRKIKTPQGESLLRHAFEEIGWPEGFGYSYDFRPEWTLACIEKTTARYPKIHGRLFLRQEHWKTSKIEHITSHLQLKSELKDFELKILKENLI